MTKIMNMYLQEIALDNINDHDGNNDDDGSSISDDDEIDSQEFDDTLNINTQNLIKDVTIYLQQISLDEDNNDDNNETTSTIAGTDTGTAFTDGMNMSQASHISGASEVSTKEATPTTSAIPPPPLTASNKSRTSKTPPPPSTVKRLGSKSPYRRWSSKSPYQKKKPPPPPPPPLADGHTGSPGRRGRECVVRSALRYRLHGKDVRDPPKVTISISMRLRQRKSVQEFYHLIGKA